MSKFKAFMKNDIENITKDVVISDRFVDEETGEVIPFKIKPIPSAFEKIIRKSCTTIVPGEGQDFDSTSYENQVAVACIVEPDLHDKELQDFYGVMSAEDLLNEMLLVGESQKLQMELSKINGFKTMKEKADEVKN